VEGRIFVPPIMLLFNKTNARKEYTVIYQYFFLKHSGFNYYSTAVLACRAGLDRRWLEWSSVSALNVGSLTQRLQEDNKPVGTNCPSEG